MTSRSAAERAIEGIVPPVQVRDVLWQVALLGLGVVFLIIATIALVTRTLTRGSCLCVEAMSLR